MEEGGGGGGGPPDYCSECKVYGHTLEQHCSEDNCTDINCTSGFHLCGCRYGHRTREYIANSRFPFSKNKRRKMCEGKKAANAAYRAANAAEREEAARELAAANPTLGIQPRSSAQLDALVTEVLASPLMRELPRVEEGREPRRRPHGVARGDGGGVGERAHVRWRHQQAGAAPAQAAHQQP
jgi:hypothetical protein